MLRQEMDLSKVLAQLREELANIDAAILSLERLQKEGRRRGRPPKTLSSSKKTEKDDPTPPDTHKAGGALGP
jgi:hypothetical protein